MKITIEKRTNKAGDKQNIRLVYWYGSYTDAKGKLKHNRKIEQLDQFFYTAPKTSLEKQHNKEVSRLVENIRAKRLTEAATGQHGFTDQHKGNANFYAFFRQLMESKKTKTSSSNHGVWQGCLVQLKRHHPDEGLTFNHITPEWVEGVKLFFHTKAKTKTGELISNGTAVEYFNKLRSVINAAHAKGYLFKNPLSEVTGIKAEKNERVYLDIDEVRALVKAECKHEWLKRAFLFSCLTGLRWSDVHNLEWQDVSTFNGVHRITFKAKKTSGLQYLDITPQAYALLGERGQDTDKTFAGLRYSGDINAKLLQWCVRAGITKHVTFHAGRHTFAVSLLSNGVDIYTVSKLMGHSEVKTTQIYADIIDAVRKDAMHKIPDIGL